MSLVTNGIHLEKQIHLITIFLNRPNQQNRLYFCETINSFCKLSSENRFFVVSKNVNISQTFSIRCQKLEFI